MKINDKIVKKIVKRLERECIPDDTNCRLCADGVFGNCPHDKAYVIKTWWRERKNK